MKTERAVKKQYVVYFEGLFFSIRYKATLMQGKQIKTKRICGAGELLRR